MIRTVRAPDRGLRQKGVAVTVDYREYSGKTGLANIVLIFKQCKPMLEMRAYMRVE